MRRDAFNQLLKWKSAKNRKPLIIKGARQVGKTWLMKEFGRCEYNNTAYVNFEKTRTLDHVFKGNFEIDRIIAAIQIETGQKIEKGKTLIILDEIQEVEGAFTSLKYFCEDDPEYHIMTAGSALGVALHPGTSFPVGKVDFLNLYPMSYKEFLTATGRENLVELLEQADWEMIRSFKQKYTDALRFYYFLGGMPEVVKMYIDSGDVNEARKIQTDILAAYENDFSKHAPAEIVPRIKMIWNSIPSQLAKESRKFIYAALKSGARAKDYEIALYWLIDSGLIEKVSRITKPGMPLKAYEDLSAFKLFINDVGLMAAMTHLDSKILLGGSEIFEEFKGALTEQYVLQQLLAANITQTYYWTAERAAAELDFIVQTGAGIYPLEVKAVENLKAKSLKSFYSKYPNFQCVRTSMSNYREESWMVNIPLYAISNLADI